MQSTSLRSASASRQFDDSLFNQTGQLFRLKNLGQDLARMLADPVYLTADVDEFGRLKSWVAVAVATDHQWACLCEALARAGLGNGSGAV